MPTHRKIRKVIDSNALQTDELRTFLAESPFHFAVLTEFAAMEAYKKDPLKHLPLSMGVLADYPRQVIVLKGAEITSRCTEPVSNPQLRLVDRAQTEQFPAYCRALTRAANNASIRSQILKLGREADANMARMADSAPEMITAIPELLAKFSDAEKRALQSEAPLPIGARQKVARQVLELTAWQLRKAGVTRFPSFGEVLDTLVFRQTICVYIWVLRAVEGKVRSNPAKARNDIIDATYAAYATFFDGLMSNDRLPNEIYSKARTWIEGLRL